MRIVEAVALDGVFMLIVRTDYADHETERYVVPLAVIADGRAVPPNAIVAVLRAPGLQGGEGMLVDAMEDGPSARALLEALRARTRALGAGGSIAALSFVPLEIPEGEPANISAQHSAAAIRYGDRYLLKVFRRLEDGESPELELGRALNAQAPGLTPAVVGAIEYQGVRAEPSTLAVLQSYVPNEGTAWAHACQELGRFFERVLTRHRESPVPPPPPRALSNVERTEAPAGVREVIGSYLELAALLGRRTAEMHLALGAVRDDPRLAPEPFTALDRRSKYQSMRNLVGRTLRLLRLNLDRLPPSATDLGQRLAGGEGRIREIFEPYLTRRLSGQRMRIARRLPPRTGALHRQGLRHHRLRGPAERDARRAAPQARRLAGRGGDDPVVSLRGGAHRARQRDPAHRGPLDRRALGRRLAPLGLELVPRRLPRRDGRRPLSTDARGFSASCSTRTSSRRRSSSSGTSSTAASRRSPSR